MLQNINDNAEHFRELSVLGKRTGAAIGLCKSRSKVAGRRRRRKWQRGLTITWLRDECATLGKVEWI